MKICVDNKLFDLSFKNHVWPTVFIWEEIISGIGNWPAKPKIGPIGILTLPSH